MHGCDTTTVILYSVDDDGLVHLAMVRKAPVDTVANIARSGAHDTSRQYWGRWSTIVGHGDRRGVADPNKVARQLLERQTPVSKTFLSGVEVTHVENQVSSRAHACNTFIFCVMRDWRTFESIFPSWEEISESAALMTLSHGDIDAVCNMTFTQLKAQSSILTDYTVKAIEHTVAPTLKGVAKMQVSPTANKLEIKRGSRARQVVLEPQRYYAYCDRNRNPYPGTPCPKNKVKFTQLIPTWLRLWKWCKGKPCTGSNVVYNSFEPLNGPRSV